MNAIRLDQLRLRVRGMSPAVTRAALEQLGPALARAWASRSAAPGGRSGPPVEAIDAGRLVLQAGADSAVLAEALADRLATILQDAASQPMT